MVRFYGEHSTYRIMNPKFSQDILYESIPTDLDRYQGKFISPENISITIQPWKEWLEIREEKQPTIYLYSLGNGYFFSKHLEWIREKILLSLSDNGTLTIQTADEQIQFKKTAP